MSAFLREEAWKTEPFSEIPKSPYDRLLDIVLEGQSLMRVAVWAIQSPSPLVKLTRFVCLAKKCWEINDVFQKFYDDLKIPLNGKPLYWPVQIADSADAEHRQEQNPMFQVKYEFTDTRIAATMILYWACLTVVWHGLCRIYDVIDQIPKQDDVDKSGLRDLPPLGIQKDYITTAHKTCQSIEFCLTDTLLSPLVLAPLNMVHLVLKISGIYATEILWIEETLERIKNDGIGMASHLPRRIDL
jgi:hypothetical protein